jgi:hypothetical protein
VDPAAQGKVYPPVRFEIDPERAAALRAIFEGDDAGDSPGVPPTYLTAAEFAIFPDIVADPALDLDLTRVLHGGQEYEISRPLQEGEVLTATGRIESIRQRGGNGFLVLVTEIHDSEGALVATGRSTMIERAPS